MDPFDLTVHQVNCYDDPNDDSFSNVVNYDTCFNNSGQSLPLSAFNVNTASFTWKDVVTSPSTSGIQTTGGGIPTGPSASSSTVHHQSVWQEGSSSSPPHLSFLVHPDDHLTNPEEVGCTGSSSTSLIGSDRTSVNKEQLRVLAQISSNTTAISQQSRRIGKFVARTETSSSSRTSPNSTVSSPSTLIPPPHLTGILSPTFMNLQDNQMEDPSSNGSKVADDNSFETVAEALRLQWSVIGNKSLAPAPPDVVAQIVAQAEKKIRTGDSSPLPQAQSPLTSPTSFMSDQTRGIHPIVSSSPPNVMILPGAPVFTGELTRVIPTEITIENSNSQSAVSMASLSKLVNHGPNPSQAVMTPSPLTANPEFSKSQLSAASNSVDKPTLLTLAQRISPSEAITESNKSNVTSEMENIAMSQKDLPQSYGQGDVLDTISEASYSSEMELEKYNQTSFVTVGDMDTDYQLESEAFLKSLPPIKPINLDSYASPPILPPLDAASINKGISLQKSSTPRSMNPKSYLTTHNKEKSNQDGKANSQIVSFSEANDSAVVNPNIEGPSSSYGTPSLENLHCPANTSMYYSPNQSLQYFSALSETTASKLGSPANSSMVSKIQLDHALKEKAKLQGQLEILTSESQNVLKERAELQSLLATLQTKLSSTAADDVSGVDGKGLKREVENLRSSRRLLEQTVLDANRLLSEKVEELRTLQDELLSAKDQTNKFQVRVQELKDDIRAKDMNTQALKNKIAELYVEVQTSVQAKMEAENESRTARNDLVSLVKSKEWYQEQLQLAHEVRSKLQRELTMLQGQAVSHGTIVERLKTESTRLRQQLSGSQQRALRDKEALARHLENIQGDMMEREAAFLEIQRERQLYEDTFNSQVVTAEEGKTRLESLQHATHELESQLDRAHGDAKKRHEELIGMENRHMETLKNLTLAEEGLNEKEHSMAEMEQKLIQMESQLQAAMADLVKKDREILTMREEKASTEIALKSALQEKATVDKALEVVKADMGKVEVSFKQMKQDLALRMTELEKLRSEREKLQEELELSQKDLEIKNRSVESMTRSFDGKNAVQLELEMEKSQLKTEVEELKSKIFFLESSVTEKDRLVATESEKTEALHTTVSELQANLAREQQAVPLEKVQMYESEIEVLQQHLKALEETASCNKAELEREKEGIKLEVGHLKQELLDRQKQYEDNLATLENRLKELSSDRQQLEAKLIVTKKSQELSQLEERDSFIEEIEAVTRQMTLEKQQKEVIENQLMTLQATKVAEVEALQQKLHAQSEVLKTLEAQDGLLANTAATNQNLELELEKERGRVIGLSQKTSELKDHAHQLEAALAVRESTLEELRQIVSESNHGQEEREEHFKSRIEDLEEAVKKEVEVQRELRKQMGSKIMESKRLKKQQDNIKMENEQLKQDLAGSQKMATQATEELEIANQLSQKHQSEALQSATLTRSLELELERVKRDLEDNLTRYPVLQEQIQSLEWQCIQKTKEVEATRNQIKMADARAQEEVDGIRTSLQRKQTEIDNLHADLNALRQEKTQQRTQVSELRGALKASVQHHKLTKQLNENDTIDKGTQADLGRKVIIPPLPFDLSTIEKLLLDTRVKPLESKPLDQLSTCLTSLRAEISGLQKKMDVHTTAVHTSANSWKSVQSEVNELNDVMRTIANTIIAANSTKTITIATASDREHAKIMNV